MTVNKYHIDLNLIEAFFHSMEMDLYKQEYNKTRNTGNIFTVPQKW